MNESSEYAEAFLDRARWLLDVSDIVVRRVDSEVGPIERDILAVAPNASDPRILLSILGSRDAEGAL